jgi:ethanolamine transporter EutH
MSLFSQLFAANLDDPAFAAGVIIGHVFAIIFCFCLPLIIGINRGQVALGVIGGILAGLTAVPLACLGGIPSRLDLHWHYPGAGQPQ